jgi:hypothetical protein
MDFPVYVQRSECNIKTEGSGESLVGLLHYVCIEPVHYKRGLVVRLEEMGSADMVHMAMGKDEVFDLSRIESRSFYIFNNTIMGKPRTAINEDRFPKVEKISGTIPGISQVRSCHSVNVSCSLFFHAFNMPDLKIG